MCQELDEIVDEILVVAQNRKKVNDQLNKVIIAGPREKVCIFAGLRSFYSTSARSVSMPSL